MRKAQVAGMSVLLALLGMFGTPCSLSEAGLREIIANAKQCVYRLRFPDGRYTGTGFVVNTLGNMVTCAHVVDSSTDNSGKYVSALTAENYVRTDVAGKVFRDMITLDVKVDTVISALDLAVLSLDLSNPRYRRKADLNVTITRLLCMRFADSDSLWEGQELFACAYIADDFVVSKPVIAKGVLSTVRENLYDPRLDNKVSILQLDLNISKGNSGGPIFLPENARVVGMIDWGIFRDSKWQTGYAVALSINQIVKKLRELKIPLDLK